MSLVRLRYLTLMLLIILGFSVRLLYLRTSHPFFDEFTTMLAAEAVAQHGIPRLPSNLIYEHGLLFTYLEALVIALFKTLGGMLPGLRYETVARWPSLWLSVLTTPVLYRLGRRWFSPWIGLLAAGLFALSPEGMVWGGRARMYALATLLALLTVFLAYEGSRGAGRPRLRWLALLALLATLLTHFGAMVLVGPLLVASLVVAWVTRPSDAGRQGRRRRPWWAGWTTGLGEGLGLGLVLFAALLVKRWGRPLGANALDGREPGTLLSEILSTVTYQTSLSLDPGAAFDFLARQFGVSHHFWLALVAALGFGAYLIRNIVNWHVTRLASLGSGQPHGRTPGGQATNPSTKSAVNHSSYLRIHQSSAYLFTLLVFGLIIVEMMTLLPAWRRNPRYLVMFLPLFYLLVGTGLFQLLSWRTRRPPMDGAGRWTQTAAAGVVLPALLLISALFYPDWRLVYDTPEPAYEIAFDYLRQNLQPEEAVLTMNVSAAGLYLEGRLGAGKLYFAMQEEADQFLLTTPDGQVDRWLGSAWLGDVRSLNRVLNSQDRVWFVTDTIRLPAYYRGDWLAVIDSQMTRLLEIDNVIVYLTRPDRTPIPTEPDQVLMGDLAGLVRLTGFSLRPVSREPAGSLSPLSLTLFWSGQAQILTDYTVFVHLRDAEGVTVAQHDGQPLNGTYPTSRWRPGESLAEPIVLEVGELEPGLYTLYAGLYDLVTLERLPVAGDVSGENAIILGEVRLP